jgi:hypothetical protein
MKHSIRERPTNPKIDGGTLQPPQPRWELNQLRPRAISSPIRPLKTNTSASVSMYQYGGPAMSPPCDAADWSHEDSRIVIDWKHHASVDNPLSSQTRVQYLLTATWRKKAQHCLLVKHSVHEAYHFLHIFQNLFFSPTVSNSILSSLCRHFLRFTCIRLR